MRRVAVSYEMSVLLLAKRLDTAQKLSRHIAGETVEIDEALRQANESALNHVGSAPAFLLLLLLSFSL